MRTIIQKAITSCLLTLFVSGILLAQNTEREAVEVASLGPQIGDRVPDFRLPDQNGQFHTLNDIKGSSGTMLLFHRSADW